MTYELSPWFSGETPPVRPGVYEREIFFPGKRRFALFNGKTWRIWAPTPEQASKTLSIPSGLDPSRRRWRGILNPPKA